MPVAVPRETFPLINKYGQQLWVGSHINFKPASKKYNISELHDDQKSSVKCTINNRRDVFFHQKKCKPSFLLIFVMHNVICQTITFTIFDL